MKNSLLYASPLPPQQSGISHYSELLLQGLKELFDITLLVDCADVDPSRYSGMELCQFRDMTNWDRFDYRLYNIGNNPWYHSYIYEAALLRPGAVILHDAVLYYLYTGYHRMRPNFFRKVFEQEGPLGVALFKEMFKTGRDPLEFSQPELLPLNGELIDSGNDFLAHSQYTLDIVRARALRPFHSRKINHIVRQPDSGAKGSGVRQRFRVPPGAVLIASFGFIAPTKLNHVVCEVVQRLEAARPGSIFYLMVGEGGYADRHLCSFIQKTGFRSEEDFDDCLAGVDLVVNLRYPSMGETSGSLLRAFSFAKPCIVCNHGWFSELPRDTVVKLDPLPEKLLREMLYEVLLAYLDRPALFNPLGRNAREWTETECSIPRIGAQIAEFLQDSAERPL
jgi:glycosyltransferase involved in cell wall biosynthesis